MVMSWTEHSFSKWNENEMLSQASFQVIAHLLGDYTHMTPRGLNNRMNLELVVTHTTNDVEKVKTQSTLTLTLKLIPMWKECSGVTVANTLV